MTVLDTTHGAALPAVCSTSRTTVPRLTTAPLAATVPLRTLVTKTSESAPRSTAARSHGPLIPNASLSVSTSFPFQSRMIRQPAFAVADVPSEVGSDPTTTQRFCRMASAVVNPTPPVQMPCTSLEVMWANTERPPSGVIWTIVVPVPWAFVELLKLLTSTSPATSRPCDSWTTAMPYGFTSPFRGTVDPSVVTRENPLMNRPDADAVICPNPMPAMGTATIATSRRMLLRLTVRSPWTPDGHPDRL